MFFLLSLQRIPFERVVAMLFNLCDNMVKYHVSMTILTSLQLCNTDSYKFTDKRLDRKRQTPLALPNVKSRNKIVTSVSEWDYYLFVLFIWCLHMWKVCVCVCLCVYTVSTNFFLLSNCLAWLKLFSAQLFFVCIYREFHLAKSTIVDMVILMFIQKFSVADVKANMHVLRTDMTNRSLDFASK